MNVNEEVTVGFFLKLDKILLSFQKLFRIISQTIISDVFWIICKGYSAIW